MTEHPSDDSQGDILIVDDDLAGLRALSTLLADQGYEVRRATDGQTALMIAAADPPDLILLDVIMPGIDGFEVCQRLKSSAATADIPVLFVSALDEVVDKVRGFEAGGVDYITKPFNAEEVQARVRAHLALQELRRTLGERNVELQREIRQREQVENRLQERVKELNCLFGISALIERPGISLEEILQGTVDLIPPAWQYPEITCAHIMLEGRQYRSERFRETDWKQASRVSVYGERSGSVEVYYLEEKPQGDEGPFLSEERHLLDAIAERLSRVIERFTAEKARQRRVKEVSTLHYITQTLAAASDLAEALKDVAEAVANLLNGRSVLVAVVDPERDELQVLAGFERKLGAFISSSQVFPLEETPNTRQALEEGKPVILPDLPSLPMAPSIRARIDEWDLQAMLFVPLRTRGRVIGVLTVGSDQKDRTFFTDEIALAETIAGDIGAALENARLAAQAQAAAVTAERQRLARALHDSVTQSLYSLTLLANGWATMADQGRLEDPADSFRQIGIVGQQALKDMRLLIHQLRPPILEEVGLVGALQQRLEAVEQRASIEASLISEGDVEGLPKTLEEQIYYIAQEALNNTLRHASASEVTVRIQAGAEQVLLSVEDNGIGFDPGADTAGIGLVTMRERAEAIGGQVTIASTPEEGTAVEVTIDLKPSDGV